jgi:hypothetical protein
MLMTMSAFLPALVNRRKIFQLIKIRFLPCREDRSLMRRVKTTATTRQTEQQFTADHQTLGQALRPIVGKAQDSFFHANSVCIL